MRGKLREGKFRIGFRRPYWGVPTGEVVQIVDQEDNPLWGRRYKIAGSQDWFEENCFEWVSEV